MSEQEFEELKKLIESILQCKTAAHRKLAVSMVIECLKEKVI